MVGVGHIGNCCERIKVGLKRGKFDYVAPASINNKRFEASGAKKKEGDAHTVTQLLLGRSPNKPLTTLPICPTSTKLFSPHRKLFQSGARLAKGTRSTTKGPH